MSRLIQARDLFWAAQKMETPEQRARYLGEVCGGDVDLRAQVEALLQADEQAGSFLAGSHLANVPTASYSPEGELIGTMIGPYKLREQIGEGGFGVVYVAEQTEPVRRKVALKVIKPGMDTREVIARFQAERQALALMDHPNIARVFDGGTTDSGRPYFVMELVRGIPITGYCEQSRLTLRQRLELFIAVCRAVQHAHQKGVIHRDLKPSNVLVTLHDGTPVPKVIDFGVAKATNVRLTEQTIYTQFAQMIGTPLYMSPEQAEYSALDVDTRTDVYSLGVLLYELLTGTTPFERKRMKTVGLDELRRIIREEEPPRPSARLSTLRADDQSTLAVSHGTDPRRLRLALRGDLDWIVMKALEKDRSRRYETASALALDIQRYLNDEPVTARPPSAWYRLRKLARRRRRAVITGAVLAVAVVLGLVGTTWQAIRATLAERDRTEQRDRANENAARAVRDQKRAEAAKADANEELYRSLVAQARANRFSGRVGQRFRSLQILEEANRLARQLALPEEDVFELRNEVIACLALPDVRSIRQWDGLGDHGGGVAFDSAFKQYACTDRQKRVSVRRLLDDKEICSFAAKSPLLAGAWASFSPDGRFLVLSQLPTRGSYEVWNLIPTVPVLIAEGTGAFSFSSDGRQIAAASSDGDLMLLDLASAKEVRRLKIAPRVRSIAMHPRRQQVALNYRTRVDVFDLETGRTVARRFGNPIGSTTPIALTASAASAMEAGRTVAGLSRNHIGWIGWHPEGRILAATVVPGNTIHFWDVASGEEGLQFNVGRYGVIFAFNGRGDRLVSLDWSRRLILWNTLTGEALMELRAHFQGTPVFSPDGRAVASAGSDLGKLQIVEFADHTEFCRTYAARFGDAPPLNNGSAATSPDSELLAKGSGSGLAIWNFATGELLTSIPGPTGNVRFEPAGSLLAGTSAGWMRYEIAVGDQPSTALLLRHSLFPHRRSEQLDLSRDGSVIAASTADGATAWRRDRPDASIRLSPHSDARFVAVSPDGRSIATGSFGGTQVKIWEVATGTLVRDLPVPGGSMVRFSPDGLWLATSHGRGGLWDVRSWQHARTLGSSSTAGSLPSFSPDGRILAFEDADGAIRLTDPETGREYARLQVPQECHAWHITFTSDSSHLIAAAEAEVIRAWNLRAIRAHLASRGLDWDLPPYPPATPPAQTALRELRLADNLETTEYLIRQGRWEEAVAYVTTMLRRLPPSYAGHWDSERMRFCRWLARNDRLFSAVQERCPDVADLWIGRGQHFALLCRWTEAADCYGRVIDARPLNYDAFEYACVKLLAGDPLGYRDFCTRLRERAGDRITPYGAYMLAHICAAASESVDPEQMVSWSEQALASARTPWYLHAAGAACFRAGRYDLAIRRLEESNANTGAWSAHGWAQNWLVLAMIHHRKGDSVAARHWLKQAVDFLESVAAESAGEPPNVPPADWLGLQVLRREAEAMILAPAAADHEPVEAPVPGASGDGCGIPAPAVKAAKRQ